MDEDITDDIEDCVRPERTIEPCPRCKGVSGRNCNICEGRGFLLPLKEHAQWIEEE